jgi:hypothetical protein
MKKRFIATLLIGATLLTACGGGSSDVEASASVSEMVDGIINCGVEFNELVEIPESKIENIYGVSADDYSEVSAYRAGSGGYADEVVVFKASSDDAVANIQDALNGIIESKKKDFDGYVQEQYDILCDSKVITTGDYVCLIVCSDNSTAISTYDGYFE